MATTLNHLAGLYYNKQNRYKEAEPLYKRSLDIQEQKLGKEHPDVTITVNNLALLYESKGRYEEAELLYQRCQGILRAKFPNGHPNIDAIQVNYNMLKQKMAEQGK